MFALMLTLSMAAIYVTNFPGTSPEEVTDGPVPVNRTPDNTVPETGSVGPMTSGSDDPGCGEEDEGADGGSELPPVDESGEDSGGNGTVCGDPCGGCGCTYTIGYWKNHAGLGNGNQADEIAPLIAAAGGAIWLGDESGCRSIGVDDAVEAKAYLDRLGDSYNGINRLYAQLLAAKLNILNGASSAAVDGTIVAVDAFLAQHGSEDWNLLCDGEKQMVNEWKRTLDFYNNGFIGPGYCV